MCMWFIFGWSTTLKSERKNMIRRKMTDIRNRINKYEFSDYVYAIIGDKKNKEAFIKILKDDGLIDDGHLAKIDDVDVIDFGGSVKNSVKSKEEIEKIIKIHSMEDPYGEEDWEDDEEINKKMNREDIYKQYMMNVNVLKIDRLGNNISRYYNIRLRKINYIKDFLDNSIVIGIKNKEKRIIKSEYDYGLNDYNDNYRKYGLKNKR